MILTLIQGDSLMKNQKILFSFSLNFFIDLDETSNATTTSWFVEAHVKFTLHD